VGRTSAHGEKKRHQRGFHEFRKWLLKEERLLIEKDTINRGNGDLSIDVAG